MYIDVHCHLDDPKIKDRIEEVVNAFTQVNVNKVINVGCDLDTSILVKEQAEKFAPVYFAAGFHPMDVDRASEQSLLELEKLLTHEKCVCVGEIGLDYYWRQDTKERQKEYFIRQLEMAKAYKLPVNVHVRDATQDALILLKENKDKLTYGGVMHCYAGSKETAAELLKLGLYFSFGGTLTFKNARNIPEVMAYLPEDRILSETDSPYLSPEPLRGRCNEPKNIPIIVEKIAQLRGVEVEYLADRILKNAKTLFYKL